MANDLTTTAAVPAVFSALSLTPKMKAVLDRGFEPGAVFTADEIALVTPIASQVATVVVVDERTVRQSIATLDVALPSRDAGELGSKLRLKAYQNMLAGCDERALAHACRRCLDELDWMPTIHQLKERMRNWVSPEALAIGQARAVLRGRRAGEDDVADLSAAEIDRVNAFLRTRGLATRFAEDGSTYQEDDSEMSAAA